MIPMDQIIPAGSGISYVPRDVFHFFTVLYPLHDFSCIPCLTCVL